MPRRIRRVSGYLQANLADHLAMTQLATQAGFSRFHMRGWFAARRARHRSSSLRVCGSTKQRDCRGRRLAPAEGGRAAPRKPLWSQRHALAQCAVHCAACKLRTFVAPRPRELAHAAAHGLAAERRDHV
jgi:hypothetical protein